MATINVAVPIIEGWRGYDFNFIERSLGKTFVEFYHAYCLVNLIAVCNKFNIDIPDEVKHIIDTNIYFKNNAHYVVCEYGIIPGLANTLKNTGYESFYSNGFGCFPTIGCFTGILGIEPSGYISACQFGHDELDIKARDIEDFSQVVYSAQRLRNIRAKIAYPFYEKYCKYRKTECTSVSCSEFSRGSCPVDLYFNNQSFIEPSYTCTLLSEATDRQIDLIQKIRMNPVKFAKMVYEVSEREFSSLIVPELYESRNNER